MNRRLNPQVRDLLDRFTASGIPEWHTLSVPEARETYRRRAALVARDPEPVARLQDWCIPGPAGPLGVRLYSPFEDGTGNAPALVYLHGGGWVLGDLDTHGPICRALANAAHCMVFAVDYRLAPEHTFPAPLEDAYSATAWLTANAPSLGVNASQVVVGGDSAGGNLAAAVALATRDRHGPRLAGQLLLYPAMDYACNTPSCYENAHGYMLTRSDLVWFWGHYLGSESDGSNPHASPLRADVLRDLPPAAVVTAEFDPLRDEGEAYAARLLDADVRVQSLRYAGTIHGFMAMASVLDDGKRGIQDAARWLRTLWR